VSGQLPWPARAELNPPDDRPDTDYRRPAPATMGQSGCGSTAYSSSRPSTGLRRQPPFGLFRARHSHSATGRSAVQAVPLTPADRRASRQPLTARHRPRGGALLLPGVPRQGRLQGVPRFCGQTLRLASLPLRVAMSLQSLRPRKTLNFQAAYGPRWGAPLPALRKASPMRAFGGAPTIPTLRPEPNRRIIRPGIATATDSAVRPGGRSLLPAFYWRCP
jgi:hypothetical protein